MRQTSRPAMASVAVLWLVILFAGRTALAQPPVAYSERHARLRAEAAAVIRSILANPPKHAERPELRICDAGHFHFSPGHHGIYCNSFWSEEAENEPVDSLGRKTDPLGHKMFDARLEIEWFWAAIPKEQEQFWTPYIHDAASEIAGLEQRVLQLPEGRRQQELLLFDGVLDRIWRRGAEIFARQHGLQLRIRRERGRPCSAIAPIPVKLVPDRRYRGLQRIEWSNAAPVWRSIINGTPPPNYQVVVPGTVKNLHVGAAYFYRFVINGKTTDKQLAPDVPVDGNPLRLPFPGWAAN